MNSILFDNFYHYACSNLYLTMKAYNNTILEKYGKYVKEKCIPEEIISYIQELTNEFFDTYYTHTIDKAICQDMEEEFDSAISYMLNNPIHKEMEGINWKIASFGNDRTNETILWDMDNLNHKIKLDLMNWKILEEYWEG